MSQLQKAKAGKSAQADKAAAGATAALGVLEDRLDTLLLTYYSIRDFLSKDGERILPARRPGAAEYAPAFRAMVAFASIFALVNPRLTELLGRDWGRHVFSERDFKLIGFDTLAYDLPAYAVKGILPAQVDELRTAMTDIASKFVSLPYTDRGSASDSLNTIAKVVGAELTVKPIDMPLLTAEEAADQLKIKTKKRETIEKRAKARELISVQLWTGEERYPQFQFDAAKGLHDAVRVVCTKADPRFRGWALALWMIDKTTKPESYFERVLGARGLWTPHWSEAPDDEFSVNEPGVRTTKLQSRTRPYYRVSRNDLSPFFFSTAPVVKAGSAPPPAGRFDLSDTGDHGSIYIADTGEGAWAEVLDRQPLVTLRDLLRRTMWQLQPSDHVDKIADTSSFAVSVAASPNRGNTQAMARVFYEGDRRGMKVTLRGSSSVGWVLFGLKGARLPVVAGIGPWDATPTTGLADPDLWKYLKSRDSQSTDMRVRLARFPGEVEFPKSR